METKTNTRKKKKNKKKSRASLRTKGRKGAAAAAGGKGSRRMRTPIKTPRELILGRRVLFFFFRPDSSSFSEVMWENGSDLEWSRSLDLGAIGKEKEKD